MLTLVLFGHVFAICGCIIGPLVARLVHTHVEEILSFNLRGVTSKLVNNWLQKLVKCDALQFNLHVLLPCSWMATSVYTAAQSATQLECSSQRSLFFHMRSIYIYVSL